MYIRLIFSILVQLYTSRIVLQSLGTSDYGIYNVVAGIVTMFVFINSSMITSTQRYLTFSLGKNDLQKFKECFTSSIIIHILIALLIIVLSEIVGIWFLYTQMQIPDGRLSAAFWVFQFSIVTLMIQIISVPYTSVIIAHEKIDFYAVVLLIEVFLKLFVVLLLARCGFDKLIAYSVLLLIVQILVSLSFITFSHRRYKECRIDKRVNKELVKEMSRFAGWNMIGNIASSLSGQGVNMLLNVFFGPVINAARGVAVQVEGAVIHLSSNLMMAINPSITKTYAQNNIKEMQSLICNATRYAFILLFIVSLPLYIETDTILILWLKTPPEYSATFLRLILLSSTLSALSKPLLTSVTATGEIKQYQFIVSSILLLVLPVSYIILRMGGDPSMVFVIHLIINMVAFIARFIIVSPLIGLKLSYYIDKVVVRVVLVLLTGALIPLVLRFYIGNTIIPSIVNCIVCIISALSCSYLFGLTRGEKAYITEKVSSFLNRKYK